MEIAITKGSRDDAIEIRRADGIVAVTRFPKKGPVPHDAVHYFVETGMGLARGFWGLVAEGMHPEDIAEMAKASGHASAKRAHVPDAGIVELLQAERLVECFEADLWSGSGDDQALIGIAETAFASSHVPAPSALGAAIPAIRTALTRFSCDWMDAQEGHVARLHWTRPDRSLNENED